MGRILPFYRTGGVVSSGSGGGNTGVPLYAATWLALTFLPGTSEARAIVVDIDGNGNQGIAIWDAGITQWSLERGLFATAAQMTAFAQPIYSSALASVGGNYDATDTQYVWTGSAWLRTPDPVEYIYSATDWANLPTQDTIQPSDEVTVNDLGYSHSSGRGQRHGNEWRLIEGKFASVADMTAFDVANVVHTDAIGLVKSGGGHDEEAIAYSYQGGAFVRFGATVTQGYAWTLTETQLLEGTDPSGIGAVQEGDYGIFAASGGPIVVRYKVVTIAAGTTTGTRAMWIPPAAYAGTNLRLDSFALGTESDAQLVAQGLAVTEVSTGTVSSVGGYIRMDSPAGASNPEARLNHPTITGAKKWALMGQIRGTVTGAAAGLFQLSTETNSQYALAHNAFGSLTTTVQQLYWTTTWAVASNTFTVRGGGSTWPASTPWLVMAESGAAISDPIETRVDGAVYSTFRRNSDGAGTGTNWTLTPQTVSGTGVSSRLELKNYFRLVWD